MNKVRPVPAFTWDDIEAIRHEILTPPRPEGGFTVREYAAQYNLPLKTAVGQLERMIVAGRLKKIQLPGPGKGNRCNFYFPVKEAKK